MERMHPEISKVYFDEQFSKMEECVEWINDAIPFPTHKPHSPLVTEHAKHLSNLDPDYVWEHLTYWENYVNPHGNISLLPTKRNKMTAHCIEIPLKDINYTPEMMEILHLANELNDDDIKIIILNLLSFFEVTDGPSNKLH